jgi:hypothetical protein
MSGHSKWATIKHQKGAKDKARGKLFAKLIRQIEVAAREGGSDVNANATLRTMVGKAKAASVPNDTIDRAIKRGTGELEGVAIQHDLQGCASRSASTKLPTAKSDCSFTGSRRVSVEIQRPLLAAAGWPLSSRIVSRKFQASTSPIGTRTRSGPRVSNSTL